MEIPLSSLSKNARNLIYEAGLGNNLTRFPDDYMVEAHEWVIDLLNRDQSVASIADALCELAYGDNRNDINHEMTTIFVTRTKSRYDRYLERFANSSRAGRPSTLTPHAVMVLVNLMKRPPSSCGYSTPVWSVAHLKDALQRWNNTCASDSTIRRVLRHVGFEWNGYEFERDKNSITTGVDMLDSAVPSLEKAYAIDELIVLRAIEAINTVPINKDLPPPPPRVVIPP